MSLVDPALPVMGAARTVEGTNDPEAKRIKDSRVGLLREMFRNFQQWRADYESSGLDVLRSDGQEWSLWDVAYLVEHCVPQLPQRQREAIQLCLVQGLREQDVAVLMGINPNNPVASYATNGIKRLLAQIDAGDLPRLRAFERGA